MNDKQEELLREGKSALAEAGWPNDEAEKKCFICKKNPAESICESCVAEEQDRIKQMSKKELEIPEVAREEKEFDLYDQRKEWLDAHATHIWNVFEDDQGEFIWEEPMMMDEGENEDTKPRKVYLPDELNKDNIFKKHQ